MGGFSNPIIGGISTLIRAAIQSANYVAGSTGWMIGRDGSSELNSGTFRGTVNIGGVVRLNSGGLYIAASGGTSQYDINTNAGFLSRNVPDNGQYSQMYPQSFSSNPQNPTPINGYTVSSGKLYTFLYTSTETPVTNIVSPSYSGQHQAVIGLFGEDFTSTVDNSYIVLTSGAGVKWNGNDLGGGDVLNTRRASNSGAVGPSEGVLWTLPSTTFKANRAYAISARFAVQNSVANAAVNLYVRKGAAQMLLADWFPHTIPTSGTHAAYPSGISTFVVGGNDVTASLVVTGTTSSGTVLLQGFGPSSPQTCEFNITDIGDAATHLSRDSNTPVLV